MSVALIRDAMKITFIITSLGIGGAEMMLYKLARNSAEFRRGRIIALRGPLEMLAQFRALGMRVDVLGMDSLIPNPLALVRLIAMLRRDRPNVVSTWLYHADLIGGLAGRWCGIPVVWGVHSSKLPPESTKLSTRAVVRVCATVSHHLPTIIACCSHGARAAHVAMGYPAERFRVIPNGFDLEQYHRDLAARTSVRAELHLSPDALLVGLIARYDPHKNHEGFLEAAAVVVTQLADVHFLLVGGGVDQSNARLLAVVKRLGLAGKVHLLGMRQDMPRLMASLDVIASASWTEAFPNILGEAMACGVPCVVTDVGDSAVVVGDTGVVVSQGDMVGLAEAIRHILTLTAAERGALGDQARARVREYFEIGAVTLAYEQLFAQVVAGSSRQ